jgi:hypothetical protein
LMNNGQITQHIIQWFCSFHLLQNLCGPLALDNMTSMYTEVADPWLTGKELFKTQCVHEIITQFFVSLQVWYEKVNTMPWNILYIIYIWKSEFNEKSVSHAHLVHRNHLRTHWAAACNKLEQRQTRQTASAMDKLIQNVLEGWKCSVVNNAPNNNFVAGYRQN